jgi:putative LysE/RhtB family amino acid efflux pump
MLLWLGWRGLKNRGRIKAAKIDAADFLHTTLSTFLLTISNPATILSFGALFAGLGLTEETRRFSSTVIVSGVFLGSLAWWFCLSGAVSLARDRLSSDFTAKVGRATSYMLIAFGAIALGSVAYSVV